MVAKSKEYLVSHGKTGVLGRFIAASPEALERGERVVIQSERGLAFGVVLCEATERQARLLSPAPVGKLLRRANDADEMVRQSLGKREQGVFEAARRLADEMAVPMEILDVEMALDGRHVILQHLLVAGCDPTAMLDRLAAEEGVEVWLENLAAPVIEEAHDHGSGGCGKPDCGKSEGGCSSCATGGGCSSCGSSKVDMRNYFGHLREKMEKPPRTPLL